MPAIVHLVSAGGIVGDAWVDDVLALDGTHDGAVAHVVVAGAGVMSPEQAERLGERLLATAGPGAGPGLRHLALLDDVGRLLRERRARHDEVALHAHGPHARSVACLVGPATGVAVVVDAGDARPTHRILPPPARTAYSSHGDLDRALEAGLPARHAAIVPPGVDRAVAIDGAATVIVDDTVHGPQLRRALQREGFTVVTSLTTARALQARLVVVGPGAHLGQALCAAVAAGVPCVGLGVPWAQDLAGCASFQDHSDDRGDDVDQELLLGLARGTRRRPRKLGKALGRAARTEALDELYGGLVGPRFRNHPLRRPSR